MLFNDPLFLFVFLPATVAAFIIVRWFAGARAVLGLLVVASIFFYGWWNPIYLPLLGGLAVFNYVVARAIIAERARARVSWAHALLTFGVIVDLLALGYFKYTDFFLNTVNGLIGDDMPMQRIVLPLGISFFTFQKIAYLVDASRGQTEEHDFLDYCFFVMFFPQLIAGPIVHHREIFSQTRGVGALKVRLSNLTIGLTIFLIGLFKKVMIADNLSPIVSDVFGVAAAGKPLHAFDAWRGAVAYSLQLYFDFSGYSDMAIGAARLFGIRLPLNFHSPFQSTGIIEFWQRWHMTLSRFLRDYLYIPLGGNRKGPTRRYVNLMLTMTIGGLWHGAAWTFVLWGFLHGSYLVINHAWRAVWTPLDRWWSRTVARFITVVAVIISMVTFRAPDLPVALRMYASMAGFPPDSFPAIRPMTSIEQLSANLARAPDPGQVGRGLLWAALALAVLWFVPNTQQLMSRFAPAFNYSLTQWRRQPPALGRVDVRGRVISWRPHVVGALVVGILAGLALLSLQHVSEFLYFEF
ncbi:MAG: MBOAT family protein [Proteobacteria bacterium]|nr:MBOAT family protein [Pseudomonadota bacterium]